MHSKMEKHHINVYNNNSCIPILTNVTSFWNILHSITILCSTSLQIQLQILFMSTNSWFTNPFIPHFFKEYKKPQNYERTLLSNSIFSSGDISQHHSSQCHSKSLVPHTHYVMLMCQQYETSGESIKCDIICNKNNK